MGRPRAQGGYWYVNAVRTSELPANARLVALVLVGIADNETGQVRVSLTTLAEFAGLGRSTVARTLNTLESDKDGVAWVKAPDRRHGGTCKLANRPSTRP